MLEMTGISYGARVLSFVAENGRVDSNTLRRYIYEECVAEPEVVVRELLECGALFSGNPVCKKTVSHLDGVVLHGSLRSYEYSVTPAGIAIMDFHYDDHMTPQ